MIQQHEFLFTPTSWIGQGKIKLNMVAEELVFFTRWNVNNFDGSGRIESVQEIQVKGLSDIMHNQFAIYDMHSDQFVIQLENQAIGKIVGKGIVNEKVIAWEFRIDDIGFDGYEFYEKDENNHYFMRAEYATSDQFRTVIEGKIWKHTETAKS